MGICNYYNLKWKINNKNLKLKHALKAKGLNFPDPKTLFIKKEKKEKE